MSSRRRVEDEGEDDGAGACDLGYESQSDISAFSVGDANLDADDSDSDLEISHVIKPSTSNAELNRTKKSSRRRKIVAGKIDPSKQISQAKTDPIKQMSPAPSVAQVFAHTADMDAMLNGLKPSTDAIKGEAIDFENTLDAVASHTPTQPTAFEDAKRDPHGRRESIAEQRSREQEESKAKRESNPASVPIRGGFFMHDHRHDPQGYGSFGKGRGRERTVMANNHISSRYGPRNISPHILVKLALIAIF